MDLDMGVFLSVFPNALLCLLPNIEQKCITLNDYYRLSVREYYRLWWYEASNVSCNRWKFETGSTVDAYMPKKTKFKIYETVYMNLVVINQT